MKRLKKKREEQKAEAKPGEKAPCPCQGGTPADVDRENTPFWECHIGLQEPIS